MPKVSTRPEEAKPRNILAIGVLVAVALSVVFALSRADYDLDEFFNNLTDEQGIRFASDIVVAGSIGVIASYIATTLHSRKAETVLDSMHEAGFEDLVDSVVNQVAQHDGVCFSDYRLNIKMRPADSNRFIIVENEYEYHKRLPAGTTELYFRFRRLSDEDQTLTSEDDIRLLSHDYRRYEYFFRLHDAKFYKRGISRQTIDDCYGVDRVVVDGVSCPLIAEQGSTDTWRVRLPPASLQGGNALRKISYVTQFPMTWSAHFFILFEHPAREIRIDVDYSMIQDRVRFSRVEFLGYEHGFAGMQDARKGKSAIYHHGWVLPKGGVQYTWYAKDAELVLPELDTPILDVAGVVGQGSDVETDGADQVGLTESEENGRAVGVLNEAPESGKDGEPTQ